VKETIAAIKHCVVVVGEGLRNKAGDELAADKSRLDAFGHPVLSGAAEALEIWFRTSSRSRAAV